MRAANVCAVLAACVALGACKGEEQVSLTREQLLDPETCKSCHPIHYREWASSMHAYAAEDPVFLAMNRRGQEETAGTEHELGTFCVDCHAPMAVREGATDDGLNLEELPQHLKGVTCYFCHNAVGVDGDHNNPVLLANDTTMRGGIRNPVQPAAHRAEYSEFHDQNSPKSSALCGGCHDIVTPVGLHLERTFAEYKDSLFAKPGPGFDTCQGCHMPIYDGVAADDPDRNVPLRVLHEHLWPGVDVALTPFPDRELQRAAIECDLSNSVVVVSLELTAPPADFTLTLETEVGHKQPSGASQDRRMWVEFVAYDANDQVIFESGRIADDESEVEAATLADSNRRAWMFRDYMFDEQGNEVHMFWEGTRVESNTLPTRIDTTPAHSVSRTYQLTTMPARISVRVRMRPMGFDVLEDLVDSRHLERDIIAEMPTFTLYGASVEWTPEGGMKRVPPPIDCPSHYRCHLTGDC